MSVYIERLSAEHKELLHAFTCAPDAYGADHLTQYLRERALAEQEKMSSATYVLVNDDPHRIDAYVTLSTKAIPLPQPWRRTHDFPRSEVPAVIIGYVAVHADGLGKGIGLKILTWVKARAFAMNETVGLRVLFLEVQAGNWRAFQQYATKWGFVPIPLKATEKFPQGRKVDPSWKHAPDYVEASELIGMYYDLYKEFGPYVPGLAREVFGD
jgi:GNAT superfamily N-acetyltransferase